MRSASESEACRTKHPNEASFKKQAKLVSYTLSIERHVSISLIVCILRISFSNGVF